MAMSGEDMQAIESRVADLQRELNSVQAVLNATDRIAEASEAEKERLRRVSRGAATVATLLLIVLTLASWMWKRQR